MGLMKTERNKKKNRFVCYDDNNISHATNGPEYGQPWRGAGPVWEESESWEYPGWISEIEDNILKRGRIRI